MSREIDTLVAEHIFGYRREKSPKDIHGNYGGEDILVPPTVDHKTYHDPPKGRIALTYFVKNYSADIAAAWEVVERLWPDVEYMNLERYGKNWCFHVHYTAHLDDCYQGIADTAPMAIALAALKAKGVTEGRGE
jgi:hypothetical protein